MIRVGIAEEDGGVPSDSIRHRIRGWLEGAPSDASAVFFVTRNADGYKGLLKVRSRVLRVAAGGIASTLDQVLDEIERDVSRQLSAWSRSRKNAHYWK